MSSSFISLDEQAQAKGPTSKGVDDALIAITFTFFACFCNALGLILMKFSMEKEDNGG